MKRKLGNKAGKVMVGGGGRWHMAVTESNYTRWSDHKFLTGQFMVGVSHSSGL